jgi:hypothetical protein
MPEQTAPLTYESVLALIQKSALEAEKRRQESDRELRELKQWFRKFNEEFNQQMQESAQEAKKRSQEAEKRSQELWAQIKQTTEQMRATDKKIGSLDHKVGNMVEKLLGDGNLVNQFRELGHKVKTHSRKKVFGEEGTSDCGEIDLFMEDGDVAILVEAKTTLKMDDVVDHIERMEKYRRFVDANSSNGKRFIGAVAGTVIAENVINFAHENGLYVIIQSARAVEILSLPEGFVAKKW